MAEQYITKTAKMDKKTLQIECSRLFKPETIAACNDLLDIYANCLLHITLSQQDDKVTKASDKDGRMVLQMILTKILYLKHAINGTGFLGDGIELKKIIDPIIIASMVRNIYETSGMFNLIYRATNSEEEREILYLLWVSAGLKYRQKFESDIKSKEGQDKIKEERKEIEEIEKQIEKSKLFKDLDRINQGKIKTKIKDKDYLIRFENKKVLFLHWHDLVEIMGFRKGLLPENIYTYFSLYAHPSNVSVFQFKDMFIKGEEIFYELANFNIKLAAMLTSSFTADYIKVFPYSLDIFNKLILRDQIVINFYNIWSRDNSYSINESYKLLE